VSRDAVANAKRIVVKVGSSVLTANGALQRGVFAHIAEQIALLAKDGREVVLVSSGAIAVGSHTLGWSHPGRSIPEKQAAAAVGQIGLVELYRERFASHGLEVAQILLTRQGLQERERFLNARRTLHTLLELGVTPIVNENDTVSTEEIRFGDNDNLSATVVNLVGAELLVILTDVEGLYTEPPEPGKPTPPLVDRVDDISSDIERAASGAVSVFGRGGMATKLEAARAAAACGASTILCHGGSPDTLLRAARGEQVGTFFPNGSRMASRKHWLAFTARTAGSLVLDAGAVEALLERGKSLLPAGVTEVKGEFGLGEPVSCLDPVGNEVARGLAAYSSDATRRLAGRATSEIDEVLGYSNGAEVIHRDDLVITRE
jgi:glutamate 5-kinase